MTHREDISWPLLNAYVDGELSRAAAARVAAAIAADHAVAAKVATLTQLRAAVAEAEPISPPPVVLPQARPRLARRLPSAVVACFALLIAAAALGIGHRPASGSSLSAAIVAHQLWLAQTPPGEALRLEVELAGTEAGSLPDLSLASLRLVHLSLDPSGHRGGGMLAGYVGPNGCRVGLWIAPVEEVLPPRPAVQDRDGLAIRAWRGAHASYALLGRGVDPARLDGIAALVARITRDEPGVAREQVAALAEAHSVGAACLG
ncbi:anti-sigma factor [Bosea sp. (in: a-proteobacteria)]|uniref:anti-sigma factor n=1 Tax=Bosea sp. (in: a-proteobacteria) TaxID=1871050 RepID=UPI002606CA9D|nr:anti-sigma factor [Bosea sp. (in: a-proteobacteria)]MCO5091297.1 anti-sigma factor [Bosea sp. (in: a-proteobacteria)]